MKTLSEDDTQVLRLYVLQQVHAGNAGKAWHAVNEISGQVDYLTFLKEWVWE